MQAHKTKETGKLNPILATTSDLVVRWLCWQPCGLSNSQGFLPLLIPSSLTDVQDVKVTRNSWVPAPKWCKHLSSPVSKALIYCWLSCLFSNHLQLHPHTHFYLLPNSSKPHPYSFYFCPCPSTQRDVKFSTAATRLWAAEWHRNPLTYCSRRTPSFLYLIKSQTLPDMLKS